MIVRGFFRRGAPYFSANVLFLHLHCYVWFLADTGASRTVLSALDANILGVRPEYLKPTEEQMVALGGSFSSFRLSNVRLAFDADEGRMLVDTDIFLARYDWEHLLQDEADRILRLPSVMGQDILSRFRFTCDHRAGIVQLEQ